MVIEKNMGKVRWTDEQLEARVQEIVASLGGGGGFDVLWTNESPKGTFNGQTVLVENILDYKFFEVIASLNFRAYLQIVSSGKVPIDQNGVVGFYNFSSGQRFAYREFSAPTEKGIYFQACSQQLTTSVSSTTSNNLVVPYMILGYK